MRQAMESGAPQVSQKRRPASLSVPQAEQSIRTSRGSGRERTRYAAVQPRTGCSVAEVADAGHEHRPAGGIDGRDRVGVADRAAGLGEGRDAGREADLDRVGEREERVRGAGGARRSTSGPSIACALATAWRAASTREVWPLPIPTSRRSRTRTIAFEVTPRTSRQARSRSSCSASVGARRVAQVQAVGSSAAMSGVVTRTAPPAVRIEPVGSGGPRAASSSGERLVEERRAGSASWRGSRGRPGRTRARRRSRGRSRRGAPAVGAIDRPGQRDDATERADRVGLERRLPGVGERRPLGGAARVGVLDDDDARPAQRPPERRRRGRVEDVVVGQRLALERAARRRRTGRRPASRPGRR